MPKLNNSSLQAKRKKANFTQKGLAKAADVSYSTLTKLEQGTISSPSITVITNLANALGCDTSELLKEQELKIKPNQDIEFVYFDVGGVLVHWLPSLHAFAERIHRPDSAVKSIFYEFNDIGCRGKMTMEELQLLIMLRLQVPLKNDGSGKPGVPSWVDDMSPIAPSHKFIRTLIKHHKIGLLTNVFKGYYPDFFEKGLVPNLSYKAVVKSCDLGHVKPERKIFEIATQAARVQPDKILFFDDSRVNVNAARDYGWHAEHFDEYHPSASINRIIRKYFNGSTTHKS